MKIEKGNLIVLSGPSGAGKSTVIAKAMETLQNVTFSISATTRDPRPGEQDGVNYYFVTRERFMDLIDKQELLEHAQYVGNFYGTPKAPIIENTENGITVLLDIEVQGAMQVKAAMPEAITIFMLPPSFEELERRLRGRNQDSEEKIAGRLETARRECARANEYDYIIVNDDVETAAKELYAVITAARCSYKNRSKTVEQITREM